MPSTSPHRRWPRLAIGPHDRRLRDQGGARADARLVAGRALQGARAGERVALGRARLVLAVRARSHVERRRCVGLRRVRRACLLVAWRCLDRRRRRADAGAADLKRLLAYSTVEHAGIVALALGFGGPLGEFAARLAHRQRTRSRRSAAFFAVGLVQSADRNDDDLGACTGSGAAARLAAFCWRRWRRLAVLPPFGLFVSEVLVDRSGVIAGRGCALALGVFGMGLAFAALARTAIAIESGAPVAGPATWCARGAGEQWRPGIRLGACAAGVRRVACVGGHVAFGCWRVEARSRRSGLRSTEVVAERSRAGVPFGAYAERDCVHYCFLDARRDRCALACAIEPRAPYHAFAPAVSRYSRGTNARCATNVGSRSSELADPRPFRAHDGAMPAAIVAHGRRRHAIRRRPGPRRDHRTRPFYVQFGRRNGRRARRAARLRTSRRRARARGRDCGGAPLAAVARICGGCSARAFACLRAGARSTGRRADRVHATIDSPGSRSASWSASTIIWRIWPRRVGCRVGCRGSRVAWRSRNARCGCARRRAAIGCCSMRSSRAGVGRRVSRDARAVRVRARRARARRARTT